MKIKSIKVNHLETPKQYYDVINANPYNNFLIKTNTGAICSHNCFFDEISFLKNKDVEQQKKKALDMIDTAIGGMKTRFIHKGKNPTLLVVASSKKSEQSFMESYIRQLKETQSSNTYVVDEPVWKVKPEGTYSKETFFIGLGNKFLDSIVIPDSDKNNLQAYKERGYSIIEAPIDFRAKALEDLDRALCDYAGISSFSSNKFMSAERIMDCVTDTIQNPMPDIITVGNGKDDTTEYKDFFDMSKLDKTMMGKPLYIHMDMSVSGDKTGICGTWIIGKKPTSEGNPGKDLFFQPAFSTSIQAPKGRQISFEKNRNFIRWLRDQGFRIKEITSDTFQSVDLLQILSAEGFNTSVLSVDRVETVPGEQVGICRPYQYLKSAIYEGRIRLYKTNLLHTELVELEKNNNTGKVDHPDGGRRGCFTGDTKISLVDGRELTLEELVHEFNQGKINYVYSFNETTKKIEPKEIINAWCTQKNASLVEVTLDSGHKIRCTPDHRFMLRDGTYREAKDLTENDSLMPLYRKYPKKGLTDYRMYYEPIEDRWHYEHRQFATEVLDEKYLVHHKNCNPKDNAPTNLVWCSRAKHIELHAAISSGACSEEAIKKKSKSLKEWYQDPSNAEVLERKKQKLSKIRYEQLGMTDADIEAKKQQELERIAKYSEVKAEAERKRLAEAERIASIEKTFNIVWDELSHDEKNSYGVRYQRLIHPETQEQITAAIKENHKQGKYENAKKALTNCNTQSKKLKELCPTVDYDRFIEIFGFDLRDIPGGPGNKRAPWITKYRKIICKEILNHKVKSVRYIDDKADVYDLTIKDNHNFALSAGVIVHNSKDQSDALCGSVFTASKHADEFAFDYGENFENILQANTNTDQYDKQQMVVDMEEELKNMFSSRSVFGNKAAEATKEDNNFVGFWNDDIIL